ncbi:MAG: hypothetical protein ABH840_04700 [Nanoarchaeota archaeon]
MRIEEHVKAYEEHVRNIKRLIDEGLEENQRNVGYNVSQGSIELFAILLHRKNLIQGSGEQFDHRIFKSKSLIEKKIPIEFPERKKILELMNTIELERNSVCYGKRKRREEIEGMIKRFNQLREVINNLLRKNEP